MTPDNKIELDYNQDEEDIRHTSASELAQAWVFNVVNNFPYDELMAGVVLLGLDHVFSATLQPLYKQACLSLKIKV